MIEPEFLDKQLIALDYLSNTNEVEQVLYGGSAGSGKTRLGCTWQILRRLKYPGTRSLIGRSELATLKKTTLNTFFEVCEYLELKAGKHFTVNLQSNTITFFNKSEIYLADLFAYPSNPNFDNLGSLEITDYFIDEVSEVTEKAVSIVHSRCRYKLNEYDLKPKGLMTCNPTKGWIYNEFYLKAKNNELPKHRAFVQALPTDNPHLHPSYLESLQRLPEYDRKRLFEGNWEFDDSTDKLFATSDLNAMFRDEVFKGEMYITADIARFGQDKTVIIVWNGWTVIDIIQLTHSSLTDTAQKIRELIAQHNVRLSNVLADEDGVGGGVVDIVKCKGFMNGSKAVHSDTYTNLKTECYYTLAKVVEDGKITILAAQHKERIIKELETVKRYKSDADTKNRVTPKEEIKRLHGFSPDIADSMMMRAYYDLKPNAGKYTVIGSN